MEAYIIKSSKVCGIQKFIGVSWDKTQIRFGLIWWHIVIYLG